jgi:hypothetical protein
MVSKDEMNGLLAVALKSKGLSEEQQNVLKDIVQKINAGKLTKPYLDDCLNKSFESIKQDVITLSECLKTLSKQGGGGGKKTRAKFNKLRKIKLRKTKKQRGGVNGNEKKTYQSDPEPQRDPPMENTLVIILIASAIAFFANTFDL